MATVKSISRATSNREVYQALVNQYTEQDAIAAIGSRTKGARITQVGKGFPRSNGKVSFQCRTNRWLASGKDAIQAFGKVLLTLTLDAAKEQAYAIRDTHAVSLTVWNDSPNKELLFARQPFNAFVNDAKEYTTKEGEVKQDISFSDIAMDIRETVVATANAADFTLEDDTMPPTADAVKAPATSVAHEM